MVARLNAIRIVLVNTSHPGNIGSVARAMKTMGLSELYLVAPKKFPADNATEMAAGAVDILAQAVVVDSLAAALVDVHYVFGASARVRELNIPMDTPNHLAKNAISLQKENHKIAFIFGRERTGLTNDELLKCHSHVLIPTVSECSSLNLAQAVQVICYELRMAFLNETTVKKAMFVQKSPLASSDEIEKLMAHFEQVLIQTAFLNPDNPKKLMPRLRRLFARTCLEAQEVNILRGILSTVESYKA